MASRIIVITGTPGSGKTTIAKAVSREIKNSLLISVNDIVKDKKLFTSYAKDGARIADMGRLKRELERMAGSWKGTVIMDGHLLCDMRIAGATAIVIREHLDVIKKRLLKRGYSTGKARDNIVSEAIDYCGERARANYKRVHEIMSGKGSAVLALKIIGGRAKRPKTINMMPDLQEIIRKDKRFAI